MSIQTLLKKQNKTIEDYKTICQQIVMLNSISDFHFLLEEQIFYSKNELPLELYQGRKLIQQLKEHSLKILQIILFVKFNVGSQIDFFRLLIEFKFQVFPGLSGFQIKQIQFIIGSIVIDIWWQYELFKKSIRDNDNELYQELVKAIQEKYASPEAEINIMWICSKGEEFRLLVHNSLFGISDLDKQEQKVNYYIQSILKQENINYKYILQILETKDIFKPKLIFVYFRLMFYYISLLYFKQDFFPKQLDIDEFTNQQYLNWQVSKTKQHEHLLLENSFQFQAHLQQNEHQIQFKNKLNELETNWKKIISMQIYDEILKKSNKDIFSIIQHSQFQEFQSILIQLNLYFVAWKSKNNYNLKIIYNLTMTFFQSSTTRLNEFNSVINIKLQNYQNFKQCYPHLEQYFDKFIPFPQKNMFLQILFFNQKISKIEFKILKQIFLIKAENTIPLLSLCLSLQNVHTHKDLLILLENPQIFDPNNFVQALKILKRNTLQEVLDFGLQIYLEENVEKSILQKLINFLEAVFRIINTEKFPIWNFFSVCFLKLKYYKINNLIQQNQENTNNEIHFNSIINFIQYILDNVVTATLKQQMLQTLSSLLSYPQDFHFNFIQEQINSSSDLLISYLKLNYFNKNNQQNLAIMEASKLYRLNNLFYKNHCFHIIPKSEIQILSQHDINQSREKAKEYYQIIKQKKLIMPCSSLETIQNIFSNQIQPHHFTIKNFDNNFFRKNTKNIEEIILYTSNQLIFLSNYYEQIKKQIQDLVNNDQLLVQQQIESQNNLSQQLKQYIQGIGAKEQPSIFYLDQHELTLDEAEHILFCIFDDLITKGSQQYLFLLNQEYYQKITGNNCEQNKSEVEEQIKLLLRRNQQNFQIKCLNSFLDQLIIENDKFVSKLIQDLQQANMNNFNDKFVLLQNSLIGCKELCPFCKRKCDVDPKPNHIHQCQNGHQLRGMAGVIVDNMPSLFSCEEMEDNFNVYETQTNTVQKWSALKTKYKNWNFNSLNSQQLNERKQFLIQIWDGFLGTQLCNLRGHKFIEKRSIDVEEYRGKKFTRVIQTSKKFHYIIALDDSGSMRGTRFENSKEGAYECLKLLENNNEARVTIIIFNSNSRVIANQEVIRPNILFNKINFCGGGTDFENAMNQIYISINGCINNFSKHVILFYTDGDANYPDNAIKKFKGLGSENLKKIELHICCESKAPQSLNDMFSAFNNVLGSTKLLQQISPENVGQTWQKQIEETVYKSC